MGRFNKVSKMVWIHDLDSVADTLSKCVGIYLRTCHHANMIGAYHIKLEDIAVELNMDISNVQKALTDLSDNAIAYYDAKTKQVYVPSIPRDGIGIAPKFRDKQLISAQGHYDDLKPSFICDLFWNDYGPTYGLKKRADSGTIPIPTKEPRQITMPIPARKEPPSIENRPPPPPPDNRAEIDSLMKRYTTEQQLKIVEVWKLVALTRKSGKIAESIILAEMRRWSKVEIRRVMYGIEKYIDRGYHTEKKGEAYLYGIMLKSGERDINAHMAMGPSNGSGPPRVSAVTEHNMAVLEQLRREREDHDLDS